MPELWLIPGVPLASALLLIISGATLSRRAVAGIGVGSIAATAALVTVAAIELIPRSKAVPFFVVKIWEWIASGALAGPIGLRLDALSLVMALVISYVGFLIHLYASEYMREEEGYLRFFVCMNLFVAAMLILVLADNLLLLYLGWEAVGLSSYLLIGFWYRNPGNVCAAQKAFLVTRIGDVGLIIGIVLLIARLGTADLASLSDALERRGSEANPILVSAALLILLGAIGKSAQVPLHVWLPDAMAGPIPVSALIHAATMVAAGVYLIARMNPLFTSVPSIQSIVALIGVVTMLAGAMSALAERDLKRILAYSTMSQVGLMFLALGAGAYSAAIFHFMTHAFFKALLFLSAGVVIASLRDERDIERMGGLWREMPLVFFSFSAGAASLAGLPFVTAGFYSKEAILSRVLSNERGSTWLFGVALIGVFLTAVYASRLVLRVFFGERRTRVAGVAPWWIRAPLIVLSILALAGGLVEAPGALGGDLALTDFLGSVFFDTAEGVRRHEWVALAVTIAGVLVAYRWFAMRSSTAGRARGGATGARVRRVFVKGFGFDALYERGLVRPLSMFVAALAPDWLDVPYEAIARTGERVHRILSATESGRVRHYAAGIVVGSIVIILVAVVA